ncbi:unnamed protein product [Peronospora belbahrii]|uniref:Protein arginine N-methyltransferase domain-containing protein n=1 Tax=Peronospora belbahrii TaxID=622444 RepID=A0ABN8D5B0_9STRA|nr:unnamed protein product [Peronospora belbahrii]
MDFAGLEAKLAISNTAWQCEGGKPGLPVHFRALEKDLKLLTKPIEVLNFTFTKPMTEAVDYQDTVVDVVEAGKVQAVLMWWEVSFDTDDSVVYSTKPDAQNWQDHWVQGVFPFVLSVDFCTRVPECYLPVRGYWPKQCNLSSCTYASAQWEMYPGMTGFDLFQDKYFTRNFPYPVYMYPYKQASDVVELATLDFMQTVHTIASNVTILLKSSTANAVVVWVEYVLDVEGQHVVATGPAVRMQSNSSDSSHLSQLHLFSQQPG